MAKLETYKAAQVRILSELKGKGWDVKADLKMPHATSPDGSARLWFHSQATYYTISPLGHHAHGSARSTWLDIRSMPTDTIVQWMTSQIFAYQSVGSTITSFTGTGY